MWTFFAFFLAPLGFGGLQQMLLKGITISHSGSHAPLPCDPSSGQKVCTVHLKGAQNAIGLDLRIDSKRLTELGCRVKVKFGADNTVTWVPLISDAPPPVSVPLGIDGHAKARILIYDSAGDLKDQYQINVDGSPGIPTNAHLHSLKVKGPNGKDLPLSHPPNNPKHINKAMLSPSGFAYKKTYLERSEGRHLQEVNEDDATRGLTRGVTLIQDGGLEKFTVFQCGLTEHPRDEDVQSGTARDDAKEDIVRTVHDPSFWFPKPVVTGGAKHCLFDSENGNACEGRDLVEDINGNTVIPFSFEATNAKESLTEWKTILSQNRRRQPSEETPRHRYDPLLRVVAFAFLATASLASWFLASSRSFQQWLFSLGCPQSTHNASPNQEINCNRPLKPPTETSSVSHIEARSESPPSHTDTMSIQVEDDQEAIPTQGAHSSVPPHIVPPLVFLAASHSASPPATPCRSEKDFEEESVSEGYMIEVDEPRADPPSIPLSDESVSLHSDGPSSVSPVAPPAQRTEARREASRSCKEEVRRLSLLIHALPNDRAPEFDPLIVRWSDELANPDVAPVLRQRLQKLQNIQLAQLQHRGRGPQSWVDFFSPALFWQQTNPQSADSYLSCWDLVTLGWAGCVLGHPADLTTFKESFGPLVRFAHGVSDGVVQPAEDFASLPASVPSLHKYGERVSLRIRVARNLRRFRLPSQMSAEERTELLQCVKRAIEEVERGTFFTLSECSPEWAEQLQKDRVLFPPSGEYFEDAGVNTDWPVGRGGFISEDGVVRVWVGEEDHLRVQVLSDQVDFPVLFSRLSLVLSELESRLATENERERGDRAFARDAKFGFVTSCPSNVGTGMRVSVLTRLPLFASFIQEWAKSLGLQVRGQRGEGSQVTPDGLIDLSPRQRFGVSESQVLCSLVTSVSHLLHAHREMRRRVVAVLQCAHQLPRALWQAVGECQCGCFNVAGSDEESVGGGGAEGLFFGLPPESVPAESQGGKRDSNVHSGLPSDSESVGLFERDGGGGESEVPVDSAPASVPAESQGGKRDSNVHSGLPSDSEPVGLFERQGRGGESEVPVDSAPASVPAESQGGKRDSNVHSSLPSDSESVGLFERDGGGGESEVPVDSAPASVPAESQGGKRDSNVHSSLPSDSESVGLFKREGGGDLEDKEQSLEQVQADHTSALIVPLPEGEPQSRAARSHARLRNEQQIYPSPALLRAGTAELRRADMRQRAAKSLQREREERRQRRESKAQCDSSALQSNAQKVWEARMREAKSLHARREEEKRRASQTREAVKEEKRKRTAERDRRLSLELQEKTARVQAMRNVRRQCSQRL
uniref:Phosphagen kinase C-terminal domain-containing protein n=1 Tax=Chromera velia CCMP2878 TaxID=1169474 RepID=A0A0G4IC81_9ALVE|eukprot:Cvel_2269.t1-p1 / transcript=Cvel_2269.t1 / gene=Cvel_2269 / organism=Chromera_velia_CCMP2878 / gene_product=Taurocyamine kinase, putative / transcript_product=Taurocyamine kinase, putative / location=Cvel_scaffold87:137713-142930(-) / protein_length=1323 / sequence_SO=supercontig / SO=protein_coding / is_pseudo=false